MVCQSHSPMVNLKLIFNMKTIKSSLVLIALKFVIGFSACKKDEDTTGDNGTSPCNGTVCSPAFLSDETAATIPASMLGTYSTTYDYEQPGSPFTAGVNATFTLTSDNELILEIEGEECLVLKNPAFREGLNQSNFFFKDDCDRNICYNVSQNVDGNFNEVNIQPYEGIGWYGQFVYNGK